MKQLKKFRQKYKYHIAVWIGLIIITIVSGYVVFISSDQAPDEALGVKKDEERPFLTSDIPIIEFPKIGGEDKIHTQAQRAREEENESKESIYANDLQFFTNGKEGEEKELILSSLVIGDDVYQVFVPKGSSVYEMMKVASDTYGFDFKGKEHSGLGFFAEEIGGVRQDKQKGMYWIYYINGKKAQVGISHYIVQPGDTVTWKYEEME